MSKQKYLLLGKLDEVLEKLNELIRVQKGKGTSSKNSKLPEPDLRVEDGYLWISIKSLANIFYKMPEEVFISDSMLDAYNAVADKIKVFPIREFEASE